VVQLADHHLVDHHLEGGRGRGGVQAAVMVMKAPQEACHSLHLAEKKGVRTSRTVCLLLLTTVLMMLRRGAAEGAAVERWGLRLLVGEAAEAAQAMCTTGPSRRHPQPIPTGQQQHEMGRAAGSQTTGNDFKACISLTSLPEEVLCHCTALQLLLQ
jgi:hypothetical protein